MSNYGKNALYPCERDALPTELYPLNCLEQETCNWFRSALKPPCPAYVQWHMGTTGSKSAAFEKVGECLYRYSSNGVYYARFESRGKEIRRSLGTTDRATAKRKLGDLQRDLARMDLTAGKCSLAEMCDRYMATVQHQKPKTVERKAAIAARIKRDFPGGADVSITKVVASKVQAWL